MKWTIPFLWTFALFVLVAACTLTPPVDAPATDAPAPEADAPAAPITDTVAITDTLAMTDAPPVLNGESAQPMLGAQAAPVALGYQDDRSDAYTLMNSFVNALNRQEYLRAYSYWKSDAAQLQPFAQFEQGYANTQSVQIALGTASEGVGAGNTVINIPVVMTAQTTDGTTQTFVGCYELQLSSPSAQATPPFRPLAIQSATVQEVDNNADTESLLTGACSAANGAPAPQQSADPTDVSADRYLDDRSTPETLMRSFANALNRHEYLRAYAYWKSDAAQLPAFSQFAEGYADTASVQIALGTANSDAGAGQIRYSQPVTLIAQTSSGDTQTFVGCYELHLSNPGVQATPPFQPLAIESATVQQVDNSADTAQLMNAACASTQ